MTPHILTAGNFDKILNFIFQFFRRFHINGYGKLLRFLNMILIRNRRQIGRVIFNSQYGFAQFVKQILLRRGRESQYIALNFFARYAQLIISTHYRFLLNNGGGNFFGTDFIFFFFFKQAVVHFFQSYVEVCSAKTKSRHIGTAHFISVPRFGLGNDTERTGGPIYRRVRCFKIYRRRQHLII